MNLIAIAKQSKETRSKKIFVGKKFNSFEKKTKLNTVENLREAKHLLVEEVKRSLKAFHITLKTLQLEYNDFKYVFLIKLH